MSYDQSCKALGRIYQNSSAKVNCGGLDFWGWTPGPISRDQFHPSSSKSTSPSVSPSSCSSPSLSTSWWFPFPSTWKQYVTPALAVLQAAGPPGHPPDVLHRSALLLYVFFCVPVHLCLKYAIPNILLRAKLSILQYQNRCENKTITLQSKNNKLQLNKICGKCIINAN